MKDSASNSKTWHKVEPWYHVLFEWALKSHSIKAEIDNYVAKKYLRGRQNENNKIRGNLLSVFKYSKSDFSAVESCSARLNFNWKRFLTMLT